MSLTRIGTANMYDRTINNIAKQQTDLANQMEHASAGKRVLRPSDDPVAAAQAERARTRLSRIESDQRTLDAQTATIQYGESTLGEINGALQEFRSLIVNAGNGAFNQTQRDTLVEQLQSLRSQVLSYTNRKDSNGLPLFRGLDTESSTPFPDGSQGIQSGQTNAS
ncbi:MAG: flagellin, partial [Comamonas sp.]